MDQPDLDRLAVETINSLDAFRKAILPEGFAALSLTCMQLSNIIEEWLLKYREVNELRKKKEKGDGDVAEVAGDSEDVETRPDPRELEQARSRLQLRTGWIPSKPLGDGTRILHNVSERSEHSEESEDEEDS